MKTSTICSQEKVSHYQL